MSELKTALDITTFKLSILKDNNDIATDFMRHWDAKRRIAILIKKDLFFNLKENKELPILVEESIKVGKDGEYLMLYVKKYNLLL